jgi:hypothetical protein
MTKPTLTTIGLVAAIIVFTGGTACDSLPTAEDTETEENLAALPLEDILDVLDAVRLSDPGAVRGRYGDYVDEIGRRDPVEIMQAVRQGRVIPFPVHSVAPGGRAAEWLSAADGIGVPRPDTSVQGLGNQDSECVGQVHLDTKESTVGSVNLEHRPHLDEWVASAQTYARHYANIDVKHRLEHLGWIYYLDDGNRWVEGGDGDDDLGDDDSCETEHIPALTTLNLTRGL